MKTIMDLSLTYFLSIIVYLLRIYVVSSQDNTINFTEHNCTVNDIQRISVHQPNTINITNCSLKTLPNALFLSYVNCNSLTIDNANVQNIEDFALNGLKRLKMFTIHRNNLTKLSSWSEHDFVNMHTLDLRHNHIRTISLKAFQHYPNLETINLSINNLPNIPENIFKYTPQLKNINFAKNHLSRIEEFTFKELPQLAHLSLEHNDIDFVDSFAFANNVYLKSIRLDFNKIVIFDNLVLFSSQRLSYVNLSYNALKGINEQTFQRNFELKILDISGNQIVEFETKSFNGLIGLEGKFREQFLGLNIFLAKLIKCFSSYGQICNRISGNELYMSYILKIFNASNNLLENLNRNVFHDFSNIKLFDVSLNKLTYLFDGTLAYLSSNVEHINLSHNLIDEIQRNVFSHMTSLQSIDLSNNKLSNESFLDEMTELKTLIMSYNQFEYLNLSKLANVKEVDLIGNPWNCTWLVVEMIQCSNGVRFGKNFSIETEEQVLTVPGIDCVDQDGNNRSIVMLQQSNVKKYPTKIKETTVYEQQNKLLKNMLGNEFGFKACLIWTIIAVLAVFGAVHIGKTLLKKSEKQSERFRLSQQVSLITTATTPTTANSNRFSDSKLIYR